MFSATFFRDSGWFAEKTNRFLRGLRDSFAVSGAEVGACKPNDAAESITNYFEVSLVWVYFAHDFDPTCAFEPPIP